MVNKTTKHYFSTAWLLYFATPTNCNFKRNEVSMQTMLYNVRLYFLKNVIKKGV
jgi:hypothetical protein